MLASGNSEVNTCVKNLLTLQRGEVHVDQLRGVRADIQDMPETTAIAYLRADAFAVIDGYEPRAAYQDLALSGSGEPDKTGDFNATSTIQ